MHSRRLRGRSWSLKSEMGKCPGGKRVMLKGVFGILIIFLIFLGGCGGGGSTVANGDRQGQVIVSLTDAEGDFVTYTVDVVQLNLTRADGSLVETLPMTTRVDFAQYTDLTEFVTAATIPSGWYTKATAVLDFSNADIRVENDIGETVSVTHVQDADGNPVQQVEMSVHLVDRNGLLIKPGMPSHLTLDFDLKASNQVEFDQSGNVTVTVEPVLIADVDVQTNKMHRLRGPLRSVDTQHGFFSVLLRPFWTAMGPGHAKFGTLQVHVDDTTGYEIDGAVLKGQAGLEALAGVDPLTGVIVYGDLDVIQRKFQARQVWAGSSVPGGSLDGVAGHVVARSADTLTVQGAVLMRNDLTAVFFDTITVKLGAGTRVSRQLSDSDETIDSISVGQKVLALGLMDLDSKSLDATEGYARLMLTTAKGHVEAVDDPLVVGLTGFGGLPVQRFDFSGTGAEYDADPENYTIDLNGLDLQFIAVSDPVKARGFVAPFGHSAQSADFTALTVIDVAQVAGIIHVEWLPESEFSFEEISDQGLVLDLSEAGRFHHLCRAGVVTDLKDIVGPVQIVADDDTDGVYITNVDGIHELYFDFAAFVDSLQNALESGLKVVRLKARGRFNDSTATLEAFRITLSLRSQAP